MLSIYLYSTTFLLLALAGFQIHAVSHDFFHKPAAIPSISTRVGYIMKEQCLINAGTAEYNAIVDILNILANFELTTIKQELSDEDFQKRCAIDSRTIYQLAVTLGEKLEPCLTREESHLKQYIMDIFMGFSEVYCNLTTELRQIMDDEQSETIKCLSKLTLKKPEVNPDIVCYKNSKVFSRYSIVDVVTKKDLCSDIKKINPCYVQTYQQQCPNAPDFIKFRSHILAAGMKNCLDELFLDIAESVDAVK